MKYSFKEMLNEEIYDDTRVMFVLGKYLWFNNMVCDTLKGKCIDEEASNPIVMGLGDEFGISDDTDNNFLSNSVDFNTFMEVIGVASINGKWFCKTDLATMNKKQKETLNKYIKEPSNNGILVVVSSEWRDYKEYLKNRVLTISKYCHLIQLSFPNRQVLKAIVAQSFSMYDKEIDNGGLDFFLMRMSSAYDDYEITIENICEMHKEDRQITAKDLKTYMKGIENFILDDYIEELLKPMSSDKTNSKKVLKIMISLEEEFGAKNLVYRLINIIDEYIDFRILINNGYIPIGVNYFFKDIIAGLPDKSKYEKMNEWVFRKKANIASMTSLRDWEYMKIILMKSIENIRLPDDILDSKCQKALYELSTRSVITPSRINNIIGLENILHVQLDELNKVVYDEESLKYINETEKLANES